MDIALMENVLSTLIGVLNANKNRTLGQEPTEYYNLFINPLFNQMQIVHEDYVSFFHKLVNALDDNRDVSEMINELEEYRSKNYHIRCHIRNTIRALREDRLRKSKNKIRFDQSNCVRDFLTFVDTYFVYFCGETDNDTGYSLMSGFIDNMIQLSWIECFTYEVFLDRANKILKEHIPEHWNAISNAYLNVQLALKDYQ